MNEKKLFLVTGMMRAMGNWQEPIAELKKQLPDFDIIPLENKGVGIHHSLKAPLTIKGNVDFLRDQYLQHKGEVNIFLGFSLGGMMVTTWSQLYPTEVDGLILVTSSFGGLQPFWKRLKPSVLPTASMAFITSGITRERFMYKMIAKNEGNKERLIKQWQIEQNKHPITLMNTIRQCIAGWIFNAKSFQRKHPTLVVASFKDQLAHYQCSENIKNFWDTDYVRHDNAGHDVLNDDPDWVTVAIKNWLDEKELR